MSIDVYEQNWEKKIIVFISHVFERRLFNWDANASYLQSNDLEVSLD